MNGAGDLFKQLLDAVEEAYSLAETEGEVCEIEERVRSEVHEAALERIAQVS